MSHASQDLCYVIRIANCSAALSRQDEITLARRVRDSGDPRAADALTRAHFRIVISLAIKHRHYGIPVADLVAEGNCGLATALRRFDPERGIRFATYARHWVRAYILAYAIRSMSIVGGSTGLIRARLFFKLRRERARITAMLGEGASADEALAERMNLNPEQLCALLERLDTRSVSLDAPKSDRAPELLPDALISSDNPEERYFSLQRRRAAAGAVQVALRQLDARERFIAEHRLMATSDELSLAEIARHLGISRERARQLETRAKQKVGRAPTILRNSPLHEWFVD
jgi:RNA polymerase sigma-32 factor